MCSQEVRPETVFLFKFIKTIFVSFKFVVVEYVFDRSNTSLKSFHFCVQSGGSAGDCIFFVSLLKRTWCFVDELCVCCD